MYKIITLFFFISVFKLNSTFGQNDKDVNFLNYKKMAENCYKVKNYECCVSNYEKAILYAPQNKELAKKYNNCKNSLFAEKKASLAAEKIAKEKAEKAEAARNSKERKLKEEKAEKERIALERRLKEEKEEAERLAQENLQRAKSAENEKITLEKKTEKERAELESKNAEIKQRAQNAEAERQAAEKKLKEEKAKSEKFSSQVYSYNKQKQIFNKKIIISTGVGVSAFSGAYLLDKNFNKKLKQFESIGLQVDPDNDGQILIAEDYDKYFTAYNKVEKARKRKSIFIASGSIAILAVAYDSWLLLNKPQYPKRYSFRPSTDKLGVAFSYKF